MKFTKEQWDVATVSVSMIVGSGVGWSANNGGRTELISPKQEEKAEKH